MKKLISVLLTLVMLAGAAATVFSAGEGEFPFTDVPAKKWYRKAVEYVWERGLMNGMTATTFEPDGSMTRAMFVTILCRLDGGEQKKTDAFSDVSPKKWYAGYVGWANEAGVVNGYPDGTFGPEKNITRQEVAVALVRYLEYSDTRVPLHAASAPDEFADGSAFPKWSRDQIDRLRRAGIFNGDQNARFNPKSNITRAEAATLLMNLIKSTENLWNGYVPDPERDGMAVYGGWYLYYGGFALQGKMGVGMEWSGTGFPWLNVFPDETYKDPEPEHVSSEWGGASVSFLSYEPLGSFGFSPTNLEADLTETPIVKICYEYVGAEPVGTFPGYVSDRHNGKYTYATFDLTFEQGEDDGGWKTAVCDTTDAVGALSLNFDPSVSACNVHVMIRPLDGAPPEAGFHVRYIGLFPDKESANAFRCGDDPAIADYLTNYRPDEYAEVERVGDDVVEEYLAMVRARIKEIKESPSAITPEDAEAAGATVWYVSSLNGDDSNDGHTPETALATPAGLYNYKPGPDLYLPKVKEGDYVFFERGSVFYPWRYYTGIGGTLFTTSGAAYGAYGDPSKPKPVFTGSFDFGGGCGDWQPTEWEDIYVLDLLPLVPEGKENFAKGDGDVGKIIFNDGEFMGVRVIPDLKKPPEGEEWESPFGEGKTTLNMYQQGNCDEYFMSGGTTALDPADALRNNLEFLHDMREGKLYLRCKWGNPATYFRNVNVCRNMQPGWIDNNVRLDNLCFLYSSYVCAEIGNGTVVTNCEAGYGGGCVGSVGTGIGGYGRCESLTVDNCYIHDIEDGPMGTQYTGYTPGIELKNVTLTNNVVTTSQNLVEMFNDNREEGPDGLGSNKIIGARVHGNIGAYIGYGYPRTVENTAEGLALHNWYFGEMVDCIFTDNKLICCEGSVIGAYVASDHNPRGWIMHGNEYLLNPQVCFILRGGDATLSTNLTRSFAAGYKMPYTERYLSYLNSVGIEYGTKFMSFDSLTTGEAGRYFVTNGYHIERGDKPS
ncbi:MAG: S-layer homology domain-containing protein [Clostridia bacterium]|nr:S-layer homology domain-containing protein [Clostridia bacterium]